METKEQVRSRVLARRDALPEYVRARKSAAICAQVEQTLAEALSGMEAGAGAPTVAAFASMRSEVDMRAFVESAFDRGWSICFPCMVRDEEGQPSQMAFYRVEHEQLEAARAKFLDTPLRCLPCAALEQAGFRVAAPEELDAVIVPLVAFDDAGRRLGYGGGNYDQLLPRLRANSVVIGVGFDEQRVETVPCELHDVALPRVVSG